MLAQLGQQPNIASEKFETLFFEAVWHHDLERVRVLVEAARSLSEGQPFLQQWQAYALGYLAMEADHDPVAAIKQFEVLRIQGNGLAPRLYERVLNRLGMAYEVNEQWDRALACYQECLELHRAKDNRLGQGIVLLNSGIVHYKACAYESALACCRHGIELLSENPNDKTWQTNLSATWSLLGLVYREQERFNEAQAAFQRALALSQRWQDFNRQGPIYQNLGDLHQRLKNRTQSESFYRSALTLLYQLGDRRQAAEVLYKLGTLKLEEPAEFKEASRLFDESLTLAQATHNYEAITHIHLSRAELCERLNQPEAALLESQHAVVTVESLRANIVQPEERASIQASRIEAYEQLVRRLCDQGMPTSYAQAFHYAEMAKSRTLIELLANHPLRRSTQVPAEWLEQEGQLRRSLAQRYQEAPSSPEEIATLETSLHQLRERIRLQDVEFASFQTIEPLTLEEVQACLPTDSVLLEYFTAGENILAFVITARHTSVTQLPLRVEELRRAFKQVGDQQLGVLHNLTRGADGCLRSPWILHNLYQRMIEPLGPIIHAAAQLYIVPHGLLHYVPFHAFYQKTDTGPRYLAELSRIVYAPSATVLLDFCQRKPPSAQTSCLALGYNNQTLTQAEAEAMAVAHVVGGESRIGPAATRSSLLAQGKNYRYVHLSCHGWFNPTWPMCSSLSLADGTLDLADILYDLQLNADLVTLSACETGRSYIRRGDELIGMVRAFLYAGTPAVLVSHWAVDELSTRLFMERFYHELTAGSCSPAAALEHAQRFLRTLTSDELRENLLAEERSDEEVSRLLDGLARVAGCPASAQLRGDECLFAHPFYWAPFFLVGEQKK
ncbi:MAG TPA: CHAT domain-containing protein [Anaerolineae bacterium]|nr:CHAT domain-containing protein [Anaerolineae bacterium]